jgi:formyl-CoA transferase
MGANQDSVFARLAKAMDRPRWCAPGSPFRTHEGRGERQAELDAEIARWTSGLPAGEVVEVLGGAGVRGHRVSLTNERPRDLADLAATDATAEAAQPKSRRRVRGRALPSPGGRARRS